MTPHFHRIILPAFALTLLAISASVEAAGKPKAEKVPAPAPTNQATAPQPPPAPDAPVPSNPEAQFHLMLGEMAANRSQPGIAAVEFLEALKTYPDAALAARAAAMAFTAGDAVLVEKIAQRWLEIEPSSLEAREMLLHLALQTGDIASAYTQSAAIVEGHAGGRDDGFRQVALLMSREQSDANTSLTVLKRLAETYPKEAGTYYAVALFALRTDKLDDAETAARKAVELSPKSKENGLLLVGVLVKQKKFEESDKLLNQLAKDNRSQSDDFRLAYAKLLLEAEQRPRARAQLQRIVKENPKSEDAAYALGVFSINDDKLAEAKKIFQGLTKSPDRGTDAHFQLGRIAEREKNLDLALQEYEQVKSGTQALEAALRAASVLAKTGRTDEARLQLQQLRDQFPPLTPRLILAEGEMLLEAGKTEEALATYNDGLKAAPDDADFLYGRSLVYEQMGRHADSEADLRAIIAKNADDARALNALGYLLTMNSPNRLPEAQKLIGKALELDPEDAAIMDSMGWVSYKLGEKESARGLLQKAYERNQDAEIAAHLGEVLWVLGQRDEAKVVWQRALKEQPEHQVLIETMKRLSR